MLRSSFNHFRPERAWKRYFAWRFKQLNLQSALMLSNISTRDNGSEMNWKYYIPHNLYKENSTSEDIYIIGENSKSVTYWITIISLGFFSTEGEELFYPSLFHQVINNLGEKDYWINGSDMYVNTLDFSEKELLHWLRLWLEKKGLPCQSLKKGTIAEFRKKNKAIDAFETAFEKMVEEYFDGKISARNDQSS